MYKLTMYKLTMYKITIITITKITIYRITISKITIYNLTIYNLDWSLLGLIKAFGVPCPQFRIQLCSIPLLSFVVQWGLCCRPCSLRFCRPWAIKCRTKKVSDFLSVRMLYLSVERRADRLSLMYIILQRLQ